MGLGRRTVMGMGVLLGVVLLYLMQVQPAEQIHKPDTNSVARELSHVPATTPDAPERDAPSDHEPRAGTDTSVDVADTGGSDAEVPPIDDHALRAATSLRVLREAARCASGHEGGRFESLAVAYDIRIEEDQAALQNVSVVESSLSAKEIEPCVKETLGKLSWTIPIDASQPRDATLHVEEQILTLRGMHKLALAE